MSGFSFSYPPPPPLIPPFPTPSSLILKRKTAFVCSEKFFWFTNGVVQGCEYAEIDESKGIYIQASQHWENPESKRRFRNLLDCCGLLSRLDTSAVVCRLATDLELQRFHTKEYIEKIKTMSQSSQGGDAGECSFFGPGGYQIASLSAGACIEATTNVLKNNIPNAYVLCRPPGHHAEKDRARSAYSIILRFRHYMLLMYSVVSVWR